MKKFIINHFNIFAFIIIALAVIGLYGKSITYDWQFLDDDVLILAKQDYLKLSNIGTMFTDTFFGVPGDTGYRPLLNVSFAIDRTISGLNPMSYHISNILIFLLAVFSIYLLFSYKNDKIWSLFFSLVIAVNPLLCAVVCRPVDRSDSLLTLFSVLSFYFLCRFVVNSSPVHPFTYSPKKRVFFFCVHILFFALALFTKEPAILLPIIYLMLLFFVVIASEAGLTPSVAIQRRSSSVILSEAKDPVVTARSAVIPHFGWFALVKRANIPRNVSDAGSRRFAVFTHSPIHLFTLFVLYIVVIAVYWYLRSLALSGTPQPDIISFYVYHITNNFVVIIKYFYNILFPITDKLTVIQDISFFILTLAVFVIILVKTKYNNIKIILFTLGSFVLLLLPTMVMNNHMHSYFQNRIFLSMVFVYYLLLNCLQKYKISGNKVITIVLVCILLFYAQTTFFKMDRYQDRWTAFMGELKDTPNSPYINAKFAMLLADIDMYDKAEQYMNKAIELEPYNIMHYENLALIKYKKGDINKAKELVDFAEKLKTAFAGLEGQIIQ